MSWGAKAWLLAACVAVASPALAAPAGKTEPSDPRIRWVDYAPGAVVRILGAPRTATQVVFGDSETIRHVAVGDPAAWEIAAEGDVLFLKPKSGGATTNLIVTTQTAQGPARHYHFELAPGSARKAGEAPAYAIRFRHPADDASRLAKALDAQSEALERKVVQLQLERAAVEGPRNLTYEIAGDFTLAPSEVSDNGRFTVMRFPGGRPLPAIYIVQPDGGEALARFDVRGEFLVVHETAAVLRLRRGRQTLCIFNRAFNADGAPTGTLTASPKVERGLAHKP